MIVFKDTLTNKPIKRDLISFTLQSDLLPGDLLVAKLITSEKSETLANLPDWKCVSQVYENNLSYFVFTHIVQPHEPNQYTIRRTKSSLARLVIDVWGSDENLQLKIDQIQIVKTKISKNLQEKILSENTIFETIQYTIQEGADQFVVDYPAPKLKSIELLAYNEIKISWQILDKHSKECRIEISQDEVEWQSAGQVSVDITTFMVNQLLPNTRYAIRLYACQDNRCSPPSSVAYITTGDAISVAGVTFCAASSMNPRIVVSPAQVQKGDRLLMQVSGWGVSEILKMPLGWSLVSRHQLDDFSLAIYTKKATIREPASYSVHHAGKKDRKVTLAVVALRSLDGLPLLVDFVQTGQSVGQNNIPFPAINQAKLYQRTVDFALLTGESSVGQWPDAKTLWDFEPKLRTIAWTKTWTNLSTIPERIITNNFGDALYATLSIYEGEAMATIAPKTPSGFTAKVSDITTIRFF